MQLKSRKTIFLSICVLLTIILFGYLPKGVIEVQTMKLIRMVISLFLLFCSAPLFLSNRSLENKYTGFIRLILNTVFVSMISALLFWDQSIILSFRVSYVILCLSVFFLLVKYRVPDRILERYILIIGSVFCVVWLLSWTGLMGFGVTNSDEIDSSRGIERLFVTGKSSLVLAFFLCLNKFSLNLKKYWLLLAGLFFVFIFLQLTRQIIVVSFVIGVLYLLRNKSRTRYYLISVAFLICITGVYNLIVDSKVVSNLVNLSESQFEENKGEENIRITDYRYFFTDYAPNVVTVLVGSGYPHYDSKLGALEKKLKKNDIYLSDVGYACMYAELGVVGLVLFLFLFLKTSFSRCPKELVFARLFMFYMLFTNIAADWYNKIDGVICICICVYLLGKRKPIVSSNKSVLKYK